MATSCTFTAMALPADGHVHSEWSWDTGDPRSAAAGTMERTCARAMRIGLPALASTEHFDPRGWSVDAQDLRANCGRAPTASAPPGRLLRQRRALPTAVSRTTDPDRSRVRPAPPARRTSGPADSRDAAFADRTCTSQTPRTLRSDSPVCEAAARRPNGFAVLDVEAAPDLAAKRRELRPDGERRAPERNGARRCA
jgi:hypothetical protein